MEDPLDSSDFSKRDITIPLLISGIVIGGLCIVVCVALILSRDYINNAVLPGLGLVEPTPTVVPCPEVPSGWVKVVDEQFISNMNDWDVGRNNDAYSMETTEIADGFYRISEEAKQGFISYWYPDMKVFKDFYLVTNVRQVSGPADGEYGIVFRLLGSNYFNFRISDQKQVMLSKHDSSEDEWTRLYRVDSPFVRPNETNELIVLGQGTQFTFCVNRQRIFVVDNPDNPIGRAGVAVSLHQAGDEAITEFDDFIVYVPGE